MNSLDKIKKAVQELPPDQLTNFRRWFQEIDAKAWDEQFEEDALSGRLDKIADKALKDYDISKCKEL